MNLLGFITPEYSAKISCSSADDPCTLSIGLLFGSLGPFANPPQPLHKNRGDSSDESHPMFAQVKILLNNVYSSE